MAGERPTPSRAGGVSWGAAGFPEWRAHRRSSRSRRTRSTTSRRSSRSGNDRLIAMVAVPMKPEHGPTLGRLLSPRWRGASPGARAAVIAAATGLLALVVAVALTLENASFSHGGSVPFSFAYR